MGQIWIQLDEKRMVEKCNEECVQEAFLGTLLDFDKCFEKSPHHYNFDEMCCLM